MLLSLSAGQVIFIALYMTNMSISCDTYFKGVSTNNVESLFSYSVLMGLIIYTQLQRVLLVWTIVYNINTINHTHPSSQK